MKIHLTAKQLFGFDTRPAHRRIFAGLKCKVYEFWQSINALANQRYVWASVLVRCNSAPSAWSCSVGAVMITDSQIVKFIERTEITDSELPWMNTPAVREL